MKHSIIGLAMAVIVGVVGVMNPQPAEAHADRIRWDTVVLYDTYNQGVLYSRRPAGPARNWLQNSQSTQYKEMYYWLTESSIGTSFSTKWGPAANQVRDHIRCHNNGTTPVKVTYSVKWERKPGNTSPWRPQIRLTVNGNTRGVKTANATTNRTVWLSGVFNTTCTQAQRIEFWTRGAVNNTYRPGTDWRVQDFNLKVERPHSH